MTAGATGSVDVKGDQALLRASRTKQARDAVLKIELIMLASSMSNV